MHELSGEEIDSVSGGGPVEVFRSLLLSAYRTPGANVANVAVFYYDKISAYASSTYSDYQNGYNNFVSEARAWYDANFSPLVNYP